MAQGRKTRRNLALLGSGLGAGGLLGMFGGGSPETVNLDVSGIREDITTARGQGRQDISTAQTRAQETLDPFVSAGGSAAGRLQAILSGEVDPSSLVESLPGYKFAQQQVMRGVQRSAAGRGLLRSGATLRALQREQGGLAGQAFQGYLSQLGQQAQLGAQTAGQLARIQTRTGGALAQLETAAGGQLADVGMQQLEAQLAQQNLQQQRDQQRQTGWGQLLGGGIGFLASGGNPAGAYAGSQIGGNIANLFG